MDLGKSIRSLTIHLAMNMKFVQLALITATGLREYGSSMITEVKSLPTLSEVSHPIMYGRFLSSAFFIISSGWTYQLITRDSIQVVVTGSFPDPVILSSIALSNRELSEPCIHLFL